MNFFKNIGCYLVFTVLNRPQLARNAVFRQSINHPDVTTPYCKEDTNVHHAVPFVHLNQPGEILGSKWYCAGQEHIGKKSHSQKLLAIALVHYHLLTLANLSVRKNYMIHTALSRTRSPTIQNNPIFKKATLNPRVVCSSLFKPVTVFTKSVTLS